MIAGFARRRCSLVAMSSDTDSLARAATVATVSIRIDGSDSIRSMKTHVPLGRLGTESEVSAAIVFLLSKAASFVTGATLRVDGAVPNNKVGYRLPPNNNPAPAYNGFHRAVVPKVLREE